MKALTVQQPWAWAIIRGGKNIENRTTNWTYRGPLLIHAGLAKPQKDNLASQRRHDLFGSETDTTLVFGAFLGIVEVVDVHWENSPEHKAATCDPWCEFGGPSARRVHLVLENPRAFAAPIPAVGRQGLWEADLGDGLILYEVSS